MIKSLRSKFIFMTMFSVILVLATIMGTINAYNFVKLKSNADETIYSLVENNGAVSSNEYVISGNYFSFIFNVPNLSTEETFFSVVLNTNGDVVSVNTQNTQVITNDDAVQFATELYSRGKTSGFYEIYRYRAVDLGGSVLYVFLDCASELTTFYNFLISSILISIVGLLLVFLLVLYLSKLALRPVYESYKKQKQFITDAGHELKTPLTIIDANAELIEMENGKSEWTSSIKNQISRLSELTENLIFLSKMDEEKMLVKKTDFSLSDAVYEAAHPFSAVAETHGKTLKIDVEHNITYCGDEGSIRRLVSLLLDNAVKYSNDGGQIELSLKSLGRANELTVKNSVDNIATGNLDILFERFYRADSSHNSQTGGSGIGLSSARAIVNAHRGKIKAKSDDGKSIVITATL
ncbi:MAG: HAMP domain-containing histidine kinase [Clostridiales bacterium]|nr:HAMP domain-containing histidine kinase [Clostridiales bacterium]